MDSGERAPADRAMTSIEHGRDAWPDSGPDAWYVQVEGAVYGPYLRVQMRAFIDEGRVRGHSLVSRAQDGPFEAAERFAVLAGEFEASRRMRFERDPANLVIIAPERAASLSRFVEGLEKLGKVETLQPGVWIVRSRATAGEARNALTRLLGRDDTLFIVDASRGSTAWFNLGTAKDVAIRALWDSVLDA